MTGTLSAFGLLLRRDLRLAWRHPSALANPLFFFLVVTSLFPLAMDPDPQILSRVAAGVVWVAALLSGLLAQTMLFRSDLQDGTLEDWVLSPHPLWIMVTAKILAHWIVTGLPLVLLAPVSAYALSMPQAGVPVLMGALALGTPVLSLLGAVGAALTVSLNQAGLLLSILMLPLAVPVLVFGARATDMAAHGDSAAGPLYLLAAILAGAAGLLPFAAAAALKVSLD